MTRTRGLETCLLETQPCIWLRQASRQPSKFPAKYRYAAAKFVTTHNHNPNASYFPVTGISLVTGFVALLFSSPVCLTGRSIKGLLS